MCNNTVYKLYDAYHQEYLNLQQLHLRRKTLRHMHVKVCWPGSSVGRGFAPYPEAESSVAAEGLTPAYGRLLHVIPNSSLFSLQLAQHNMRYCRFSSCLSSESSSPNRFSLCSMIVFVFLPPRVNSGIVQEMHERAHQ